MPKPLIIGLSHLYGECRDLARTTQFWKKQNLTYQEFQLPVTTEKSQHLLSSPATTTILRYFKTQGPGFEFLEHSPKRSLTSDSKPLIEIFFYSVTASLIEDPDKNLVVYDPSLTVPVTLKVRVQSVKRAASFFEDFGFEEAHLTPDEAVLLEIEETALSFKIEPPLFPQMRCRIVLVEDASVEVQPKIDHLGLSGLSFIVSSLDETEKVIALKAHQDFEDPLSLKRVAFTNEFGVMIEFLEIVKRKPSSNSIDKF